jgi:aryl sulfotransferase
MTSLERTTAGGAAEESTGEFTWPVKTRDIHNSFFVSRVWDELDFRDDDIIIGTWAKSGTSWTQQIVGQLIFNGQRDLPVADMSPWLDFAIMPENIVDIVKAQTHRRFIKTHLPLEALTFSPRAKYLYVGRDGRDSVWSLHNAHANFTAEFYEMLANNPAGAPIRGRV